MNNTRIDFSKKKKREHLISIRITSESLELIKKLQDEYSWSQSDIFEKSIYLLEQEINKHTTNTNKKEYHATGINQH